MKNRSSYILLSIVLFSVMAINIYQALVIADQRVLVKLCTPFLTDPRNQGTP